MEEIKGKNTEELLESLNSLLDKMPGLLKQAEELQISRRELEKEKDDAEKKTAGMMNLPVGNSSDFAQTSDYNEYQIPEIRQESDTASRIKENDEHKASETAAAGPDEKTDPVFRKAPASMPQDHRRRVVFLYSESSELL
ncbi:MAG: hypothetical protein J5706_01825, partial [Elusimicrobiales bacterium]|nr:hypothetical protein [Elusimicrobiales bacterium]